MKLASDVQGTDKKLERDGGSDPGFTSPRIEIAFYEAVFGRRLAENAMGHHNLQEPSDYDEDLGNYAARKNDTRLR
jgi:hypothetical protein